MMNRDHRLALRAALFLTACTAIPSLLAAQSLAQKYELRPGSKLIDECVFCDRAPIETPLTGSFLLTQIPSLVCCIYEVTEVSFQDADGRHAITGEGVYSTSSIGEVTQQLSLRLDIDGTAGIELATPPVSIPVPFPAIEITITEDGNRDPAHRFTLVLVAAPEVKSVEYEVVGGEGGSYLIDGCLDCERPDVQIPVTGSFRLARLNDEVVPVGLHALEELHLQSELDKSLDITGSGLLEYGGEVALTQHLGLSLRVNGTEGVRLDSGTGRVPDGVVWPELQILLSHENPEPLHVYTLYLVARPAKPSSAREFRRGDSNGDGGTDISDAIHILGWRFGGGGPPGCLDAADTNGDALHDLSDAIFLLQFLFQGGSVPPAPGPEECGTAPENPFGCAAYASC